MKTTNIKQKLPAIVLLIITCILIALSFAGISWALLPVSILPIILFFFPLGNDDENNYYHLLK